MKKMKMQARHMHLFSFWDSVADPKRVHEVRLNLLPPMAFKYRMRWLFNYEWKFSTFTFVVEVMFNLSFSNCYQNILM